MKMLFNVNQTEALRLGINAPSSTVTLDVDPAELSQLERDILAAVINDGHDCTKMGIRYDDFPAIARGDQSYHGYHHIQLIAPTLDGLHEAVVRVNQAALMDWTVKEERRKADRAENDRKIDEILARGGMFENGFLFLRESGEEPDYYPYERGYVRIAVMWPHIPISTSTVNSASPEKQALLKDAEKRVEAAREEIKDRIGPQLVALRAEKERADAEKERAEAAEKALVEAEYAAVFARLPQSLRERAEAGYAAEKEVLRAIRCMLRNDAGYPEPNPKYTYSETAEELTNAEFAALKKAEAGMPDGATISAVLCWDESTEEDDDGEEESVRSNKFNAAKICWSVGGVDVVVIVPLA